MTSESKPDSPGAPDGQPAADRRTDASDAAAPTASMAGSAAAGADAALTPSTGAEAAVIGAAAASERAFFSAGDASADAPAGAVTTVAADEIDPDLLRLPRRRRRRHPAVSLAVILLSGYLLWFVREDFAYFLQPIRPADLGDATRALAEGRLTPNRFVTLAGAPDRKHALILEARFGGFDSFFRLLDARNRVYVQAHRETRATDTPLTGSYTGKLVRFANLPYHDSVAAYFQRQMTVGHDLDFAQLAQVKARFGRGAATALDRTGEQVALTAEAVLWINVTPAEEWVIQLAKHAYPTEQALEQALVGLGLPLAADPEPSASFYRYVVRATPEQVPALLARFKDEPGKVPLGAPPRRGVVRRQVSYSARWDQLSVAGRTLVIDAADPTFPLSYRIERSAASGPGRLVGARDTPVRLAAEAVLFISASSAYTIPPDALVLLVGRTPGGNWYYLVLTVVLGLFILLNGLSLVLRLRERRRPRPA